MNDATPHEDAAAGASGAGGGAGDADAAPVCEHRDVCAILGSACANSCGQPCTCEEMPTRKEWRCVLPVGGSACDPETYESCFYPPESQTDGETCWCQAPAGEYFWTGCGTKHVCPADEPPNGTTCAGVVPAGMLCTYPLEGNYSRHCECTLSGGNKLWSCDPA